ncbi:MAG: MotA/TolQ/ExbB proton channel family protein [Bacterioplanes sp.]|nr:MotA/TolQ/ExbB proton channel family protein [Bacterioplanes sp.]
MDRWGLALCALAIVAILFGFTLEGGHLALLWNGPAILIVMVGSILATLAQMPLSHIKPLSHLLSWLIAPPNLNLDGLIAKLTACANAQRRDGVLALEKLATLETDPVVQRALTMLTDGYDQTHLLETIELELATRDARDNELLDHLDQLASYLPTLGIVGAVLGLMQVLSSIKDPDALAAGIATAFVATFYGVAAANVVVIPLANRLRQILALRRRYYQAMLVGIVSLRQEVNPMVLRFRMQGISL